MKMITNNSKLMAANVTAQRGQKFVSSTHFGFKLHQIYYCVQTKFVSLILFDLFTPAIKFHT